MNPHPRVLVSARVFDRQVGGNTRYVRNVYERIADYGVKYRWARPSAVLDKPKIRSAVYGGLESVLWPLVPPGKPTLVHYPADTGASIPSRTPVVSTIHGLATLHMTGVRSGPSDALWRSRVRRLARVSDQIITVSQSSADDIAFFEPRVADRLTVIHHGIDHDRFNRDAAGDYAEIRNRLSIPEEYFLYAGNLDPRKNVVELTKAAQRVFEETGTPLVVSGAPAWESAESMHAIESTPGVIYVGRTSDSDLVALLQNTLAFCFPSLYEGFGFPVLEAMACGSPVICSDRGSLGEVARGASHMISKVDSSSIADAMLEVHEDTAARARLVQDGLEHVKKFQWSESAAKHAELFKAVSK